MAPLLGPFTILLAGVRNLLMRFLLWLCRLPDDVKLGLTLVVAALSMVVWFIVLHAAFSRLLGM